ncbi:helix-turn-helix domain-containing protein [Paradevosia shaoguanensis]|uniref:helix-turn-helix domain-containing protein n=1 Tax=Paradevosia shaoguanensis TaxID=1335043 RepID=UPI003C75A2CE
MNSVQLRMARAALRWGVREVAEKAGITANTVTRIEGGADAKQSTIAAMQRIFEAAGVVFLPDEGQGAGVRAPNTSSSEAAS